MIQVAMNPTSGALCARWLDLSTATNAPIELVLSPPKDVRINGAAPFADGGHVGLTPAIRWSRPDRAPLGPIRYSVEIGNATIWTLETSVTIPSGLLEPNKTYDVEVIAEFTPDPFDFAHHPIDGNFSEYSSWTSGTFMP
jgi:hypothetical protein